MDDPKEPSLSPTPDVQVQEEPQPTSDLDNEDDEEPEIVTMIDVLKEETELEENADAGESAV